MLITVLTFNGHNINDGADYSTLLLNPHGTPASETVFLNQVEADSIDAGTFSVDTQVKTLSIKILDYADRQALIAQLKTWLKRGEEGDLVVKFSDEGINYQMACRVVALVQDADFPQRFVATLETGVSEWRAVTETTETTWVLTTDDDTQTIDVGGKDETYLSLDIEAVTGPATGYLYQDIYRLPNTPGVTLGQVAWCITVDTAALVTATKMQADCDDLRIINLYTGKEIKRWISNPNNAATKVWVVLNLRKGFSLTLLTAVAGAGDIEYLQFTVDGDHTKKIAEMPKTGIVYHGNEWFAYHDTDSLNCRLIVSKRGLFGTTVEAHSSSDTFLYIQYPLAMKYGNATVASPASTNANYDNTKPLISLSSSTNASWVWTASEKFYDLTYPNKVGRWKFSRQALGRTSYNFHIKQDAESGDPAMGSKVASFQTGITWQAQNCKLAWLFYHGAGITSVSMTGDKYRNTANWIELAALQRSANNISFFNLWTESTPASISTWTAWTHNSVSVAAGSRFLQLVMSGAFAAAANGAAYLEALTATVAINSSNLPTGAFLGEEDNYPLTITIENETTGDAITLDYMMRIGKSFLIDGEENIVEYDGSPAHSAVSLNDEGRGVFLRLQGNATNTIRITGGGGELDIDMHYYKRRL